MQILSTSVQRNSTQCMFGKLFLLYPYPDLPTQPQQTQLLPELHSHTDFTNALQVKWATRGLPTTYGNPEANTKAP